MFVGNQWESYLAEVMPPDAPRTQVQETRRAFYAGAAGLLSSILNMLDPGTEATEADLAKMDAIQSELDNFSARVGTAQEGVNQKGN